MIKNTSHMTFVTLGRGDHVFIYPTEGMISLYGSSVKESSASITPEESGFCKKSDIPHIAALQQRIQKSEMQKRGGKQVKSILKNSQKNPEKSDSPDNSPEKLSVSKIRCVLKKRKTTNESGKPSARNMKCEKKVKFDDKLNRLTELGAKYGQEVQEKENLSHDLGPSSHIRQHKQIQKVSLRNSHASKAPTRQRSSITISNVYDLSKGPLDEGSYSPGSLSKSVSSDGRSTISCERRNSGSDQFVRMDFEQDDLPIPIYNPKYSSYPSDQAATPVEETDENNEIETKLIQNGIPAFTKSGKFIKNAELLKETSNRSKMSAMLTSVKPNYRVSSIEKKFKLDQECLNAIPGHRKVKGKTTVNTNGGATVTRSHNPPLLFTRYTREITHIPPVVPNPYKNYCDDVKTYQILSWLKNISDIQSKEGFCTLLHSEAEA